MCDVCHVHVYLDVVTDLYIFASSRINTEPTMADEAFPGG